MSHALNEYKRNDVNKTAVEQLELGYLRTNLSEINSFTVASFEYSLRI